MILLYLRRIYYIKEWSLFFLSIVYIYYSYEKLLSIEV